MNSPPLPRCLNAEIVPAKTVKKNLAALRKRYKGINHGQQLFHSDDRTTLQIYDGDTECAIGNSQLGSVSYRHCA